MAKDPDRPMRVCDSCGGVDDAPRHEHAVAPGGNVRTPEFYDTVMAATPTEQHGGIARALADTSVVSKHMDCCADDGCPTGTCEQVMADAGTKRNAALVRHLTKEA